jgi:hypothetical protein
MKIDKIKVLKTLVEFWDARDWQQFHGSKNFEVALSIKAAELNEVYLWKDVNTSVEEDKVKIKEYFINLYSHSFK